METSDVMTCDHPLGQNPFLASRALLPLYDQSFPLLIVGLTSLFTRSHVVAVPPAILRLARLDTVLYPSGMFDHRRMGGVFMPQEMILLQSTQWFLKAQGSLARHRVDHLFMTL